MTLRRLCTWHRWIIAASPACQRTAAASALPPSNTYRRGRLKSSPRPARSPSNSLTTVLFSVAPSRRPNTFLRPSTLIPRATIICRPRNGVPSISTAHKHSKKRTPPTHQDVVRVGRLLANKRLVDVVSPHGRESRYITGHSRHEACNQRRHSQSKQSGSAVAGQHQRKSFVVCVDVR